MKKRFRDRIICMCMLIFCTALPSSAFASEQTAKQADMTVFLIYEESDGKETKRTALPGAEILLYKIASLTYDNGSLSYTLEPPYRNSGLDINHMTAAKSSSAAKKLQDIIKSDKVAAARTGKADQKGTIIFDGLDPGMYLGVQKEPVKVKQKSVFFEPSLWMAPEGEQNKDGSVTWNERVAVYPKVSPKITKESDKPPVDTPDGKTPKKSTTVKKSKAGKFSGSGGTARPVRTGDENKVQMYVGIFIMSVSAVLLLLAMRRKKKQQ